MRLLDQHNATDYLRNAKLIVPGESPTVRELTGGVSNVVLLVERDPQHGDSFILKQARDRLRVAQLWRCSVERIWREVATLRTCQRLLASESASGAASGAAITATVPEVLFEDRDNYVFAMTAAPPAHCTWKSRLLAGDIEADVAAACGRLLGTIHAGAQSPVDVPAELLDRTFFDDLRVDPYYRRIAAAHPDLQPQIASLIASLEEHPTALVHGDFSPKNLLVWPGGLMLIDCEVGHWGDPAFDLGFFLSHLVLKSVYHASSGGGPASLAAQAMALCPTFWQAYKTAAALSEQGAAAVEPRAASNLAGCLLARVDGKSPVDYLAAPAQRDCVRK
ncbi:MAG: phosphotransferase, partial [Planctomycetales bacterium]|nr:phosphotransferase [Planctomycetales bacterium]